MKPNQKSSHQQMVKNSKKDKTMKLDFQRIGMALGVLALLLLTIIAALSGREKPLAGQAFFVDLDNLPSNVIQLSQEETLIFRQLPAQASTVRFSTAVDLSSRVEQFTLTLIKDGADSYIFEINNSGALVVRDRLDAAGDVTSLYLNARDALLDLELSLQNGQLQVSNLHFVSPDLLKLRLTHNETGVSLGRVLRVNLSQIFYSKLNVSSPEYPELELNVITTLTAAGTRYNNTFKINGWNRLPAEVNRTINITFGPINEPASLLLNVTGTVLGGKTAKFLVLAVGNRTLDVNDSGYPLMRLDFIDDLTHQGTGRAARLNVTFRDTTELQPFALPCRLPDSEAVLYANGRASGFLAKDNIAKIYSYDPVAGRALQSASAAPIGQIPRLSQFEGYFVQLARAEPKQIIINNCQVEDPQLLDAASASALPSLVRDQLPSLQLIQRISRGWNLFSIPGVVPTSLKEISPASARFELFACAQGELCRRLNVNDPLLPGRPYWVYSTSEFTVAIE